MNLERTVIALGFFDGVHRGHGALLQKTVQRAGELGAIPAVFTFDRPPKEVVTGRPMPLINSPEDRADLARRIYGIQQVILAPFDEAMMREIRNNAISDMMEPGSTFKTASILVALDDGVIDVYKRQAKVCLYQKLLGSASTAFFKASSPFSG